MVLVAGPHGWPRHRSTAGGLDVGQQAELLAEVDRVELSELGPLADRVVAEAYGFAPQLVENHEQLAVCVDADLEITGQCRSPDRHQPAACPDALDRSGQAAYTIAGDRRRFVDLDEIKRMREPKPLPPKESG